MKQTIFPIILRVEQDALGGVLSAIKDMPGVDINLDLDKAIKAKNAGTAIRRPRASALTNGLPTLLALPAPSKIKGNRFSSPVRNTVLRLLRDAQSPTAVTTISAETGLATKSVLNFLLRAKSQKFVKSPKRGVYGITELGKKQIED
jgi:hypothetical protein